MQVTYRELTAVCTGIETAEKQQTANSISGTRVKLGIAINRTTFTVCTSVCNWRNCSHKEHETAEYNFSMLHKNFKSLKSRRAPGMHAAPLKASNFNA
jgi:hypothetical protein